MDCISTAVVTGATGFVATELVAQLLSKGYAVRATVRSVAANTRKHSALTKLAAALPGTLQFFEADLGKEGSFDDAVKGADYIFHVASPFTLETPKDPQKELIDPAVNGTKNLLGSVVKSKDTIKRVVLTSSVAAFVGNNCKDPPANGVAYTEEDWNTASTVEADPYPKSKTEAERTAWEIAKAEGLPLATVLPSYVMGPVLSPEQGGVSVKWMSDWLEGVTPWNYFSFVDVRDIARAHILAAETPAAVGNRYIVAASGTSELQQYGKWLQERFPELDIPLPEDLPKTYGADNSKVQRELGLAFTPLRETFVDMAVTLLQLGIARPGKAKAAAK